MIPLLESIDQNKLSRKLAYLLVAMLGCGVQLYFVCEQYFRYSVVTDLVVSRNEKLTLPGMAICFNASSFEKKDFSGPVGPLEGKSINELMSATRDPFDPLFITNMTLTEKGIFFANNITSPANPIKIWKFMRKEDYCFAVETKWDGFYFSRDHLVSSQVIPQIFAIRFKTFWFETIASIKYFFYSRMRKFCGPSESSTTLIRTTIGRYNGSIGGHEYAGVLKSPTRSNVAFARYNSTLLEAPYESKCRKYEFFYAYFGGPFSSQGDCFHTCYLAEVKDKYHLRPSILSVENSTDSFVTNNMASNNRSLRNNLRWLFNKCYLICERQNCIREDFIVRKVSDANYKDSGHMTVSLLVPVDPDMAVTAKPMMEMIEFVTYVLSCISFWFGFAPFGFFSENDVLLRAHGYIVRRYTKGKNAVPIKTRIIRPPKFRENIKRPQEAIGPSPNSQQLANESLFVVPNRERGPSQTTAERRAEFGAQYSQASTFCASFNATFSEEEQFYTRFSALKDFDTQSQTVRPNQPSTNTGTSSSSLAPPHPFGQHRQHLLNAGRDAKATSNRRLVNFDRSKPNKSAESFNNLAIIEEDEYSQEERDLLEYMNRIEIWFKEREEQLLELTQKCNSVSTNKKTIESQASTSTGPIDSNRNSAQIWAKKGNKRKGLPFSSQIILHR